MRDFLSSLVCAATLALALVLPAGAASTPWQALAPTMFEHLVPAERGFPSPITMAIAQDGDGFIWFGTQSGLGRWDGYRMRNFFYKADDPRSLPGDFLQTLHIDRQGRLWVGSSTGGVAMYDKFSESFVRYPAGPKGLSSPSVSALASDDRGNIWVGTASGLDYIDLINGGAVSHHPRAGTAAGGAASEQIRALLVDRSGHLWIGSNGGLARRDAASGLVEDLPFANSAADAVLSLASNTAGEVVFGTLKSGVGVARAGDGARILALDPVRDANNAMVLSITEILPGTWWAATYGGGIIEFDTAGHSRRIAHRPGMGISLGHDRTAAVWRDRSGLIWVANERGIDIHNPSNRNVDTVLDGAGLSEISAIAFMTDSGGRLWVALGDQGIDLIDADGQRSAGLRPNANQPETALPQRLILGLAEAEPQEAWIATALGLYHTSGKGTRARRVALPLDDPYPRIGSVVRQGDVLWLAVPSGLMRYDLRTRSARVYDQGPPGSGALSDRRISVMRVGPDGMLWIGTRNGLNRFDPATGQARQFVSGAADQDLPHSLITGLTFDRQQRLWVGTNSDGIGILDRPAADGAARFRKLRMAEGLPANNIAALHTDQSGRVWASTSDGIAVIDATSLKVHTLDRASGLVFQPYFVGAVGETARREVVFGTSGGFVVAQPVLPQSWRHQPPLVVSTVRLDNRVVPAATLLTPGGPPLAVPPGTRKVEVEVAALDFSASLRNRYAFRLDGYDKDWVEADASHRAATYANVPPGTYRLHMRGSNRDGVWSPHELSMEIRFLPAWYQTWWARLGAALAVLALAWGVYRWRVRNLQQQVYSRTLHLERVHAIVKSINDELDFDALLHTILRESSTIGGVSVAYALIAEAPDGPLALRAAWGHDALPSALTGMSPAAAQAQFVDAAALIAPDMFLKQSTMLAVRIRVEQQVQGYLVFKQNTPFLQRDLDMFKALKEPFVSAFQKASAIRAIQQARADAEASTRAKSEFLANISHEIRTPMNAILGFAGLGTHLDLPAKPRDYFTKIGRAGQNLLSIIDDVLDFAKIESGKLELETVPFDLGETLAQITDLFSWRAAEKGLELLAWATPEVPLRLVGDPLRLNQVLVNLVGNALKFTAAGHICLRVELVEDGAPVRLRFIVDDSGVGISDEQQARLFRAFSQADASTTRLYGGTGLGLAISQQLVQAMGGQIGIDSKQGEGSRFYFELALQRQPGAHATPAPLPAEAAGKRILVVDDSAQVREMLRRQLDSMGFATHVVEGSADARAYLATGAADLVLLDGDLPPLDSGVPVVLMVTEFARGPGAEPAGRDQALATLVKPVHPPQLLDAVLVGLGLATPARPEAAAAAALSEAAQHIAGARVLVVDDNVINQQVAREVLLRAGVQADLAGSGAEAVQMVDAAAYDAVLMDIQMPGMDGYEATARIRAKAQHARLPLIAMTAHAVAGFRESSLGMGMSDYVTKPIDPERLFAVLADQLRRTAGKGPASARSAANALAPAAATSATANTVAAAPVAAPPTTANAPSAAANAPSAAPSAGSAAGASAGAGAGAGGGAAALTGIDLDAALARLGGNDKLLTVLLNRFLADFEASPKLIMAAIGHGAYEQAALLVHKVRGAAGNLSMPELHHSATELEQLLSPAPDAPPETALASFAAALETVLDTLRARQEQAQSTSVSP